MTDDRETSTLRHGAAPQRVPDDGVRSARRRHPVRTTSLVVGFVVMMVTAVIAGKHVSRDPSIAESPLLGKAAPAIQLPRIDTAGTVESWQLRGRVVIINFWATWCVPCRRENKYLDDFYQRSSRPSVELIGILFGDTVQAARTFRDELGGTWPLVNDPHGATAVAFGVTGVPETFIIDENGFVVARLIGAVGPTTLDEVLAQLATGSPTVTYRNDREYRETP